MADKMAGTRKIGSPDIALCWSFFDRMKAALRHEGNQPGKKLAPAHASAISLLVTSMPRRAGVSTAGDR
jgi:hypothetical protein